MFSLDFIVYDMFSFSELLIILTCLLRKLTYVFQCFNQSFKTIFLVLYLTFELVLSVCTDFSRGKKTVCFYDEVKIRGYFGA